MNDQTRQQIYQLVYGKLLLWTGYRLSVDREAKVNTCIAVPYNPYHQNPYLDHLRGGNRLHWCFEVTKRWTCLAYRLIAQRQHCQSACIYRPPFHYTAIRRETFECAHTHAQ